MALLDYISSISYLCFCISLCSSMHLPDFLLFFVSLCFSLHPRLVQLPAGPAGLLETDGAVD